MGEWEPDGAELGNAGSVPIEEAAGDVDVGLGIAVEEEGVVDASSKGLL